MMPFTILVFSEGTHALRHPKGERVRMETTRARVNRARRLHEESFIYGGNARRRYRRALLRQDAARPFAVAHGRSRPIA
ncbi:hypothetical protein BCEP4_1350014 [Burkholderia cepacia]|nr:hypothetical protein BCEP4_1350014 [Burkholderia cepacia]